MSFKGLTTLLLTKETWWFIVDWIVDSKLIIRLILMLTMSDWLLLAYPLNMWIIMDRYGSALWYFSGDYYIRAYWCDIPIQLFPIIATATVPEPEVNECEVRPELVSVSGPGISFAYCHENADFVIDGHEAGPGSCLQDCFSCSFIYFEQFIIRRIELTKKSAI